MGAAAAAIASEAISKGRMALSSAGGGAQYSEARQHAARTAPAAIFCHKASRPLTPLHHRRGPRAR
jgi:hypothetical protein